MAEHINNGRDIKMDDGQIIPSMMSEDRLYTSMSRAEVNAVFDEDTSKYALTPDMLSSDSAPTTINIDADKHKDFARDALKHDPKWDCYDSADYADYSTYHPDIMKQLEHDDPSVREFIANLHQTPTTILAKLNKAFSVAGLRAIQREEMPDFPKDDDANIGWDMKWVHKHIFIGEAFKRSVFDASELDEKSGHTRLKAVHTKILLLARENEKLAARPPTGHAVTLGYYEDPATNEKISTPPNSPSYLREHISLKNAHRSALSDANYRDRYIASQGVICHCCGTPVEKAKSWPMAGVKLLEYHSGTVNHTCTACRNIINPVLARTGKYGTLPPEFKEQVDGIIEQLLRDKGQASCSMLSTIGQFRLVSIVKAGIEEAHANAHEEAASNTESVDDVLALVASLKKKA